MSTNGRAGYYTTIEDTQGAHPRKHKLIKQKACQNTINKLSSEDEEKFCTEEEKQDSGSGSEESEAPTTSQTQKTYSVINLVTAAKLSIRKAHTVCKTLAKIGISLSTPSESGVYKAIIKAGEKLIEEFIKNLKNENWSLNFD